MIERCPLLHLYSHSVTAWNPRVAIGRRSVHFLRLQYSTSPVELYDRHVLVASLSLERHSEHVEAKTQSVLVPLMPTATQDTQNILCTNKEEQVLLASTMRCNLHVPHHLRILVPVSFRKTNTNGRVLTCTVRELKRWAPLRPMQEYLVSVERTQINILANSFLSKILVYWLNSYRSVC